MEKEGEDEIQSTLQQCSRVVLVGQGNYVFLVHKEGKEEEEEEKLENKEGEGEEEREEEEEEKDQEEITTAIQSFAVMQHSCTVGLGYLVLYFFVNKEEEEEEEEEEETEEELAVVCFSRT